MNERIEYYWIDGRLVEFVNTRKSDYGPFPKAPHPSDLLVAWIRRVHHETKFEKGPEFSDERMAEVILRFGRMECDLTAPDIGKSIPERLVEEVSAYVREVTERVTRQWESVGNEEGGSGMFAGNLNEAELFTVGNWTARIRTQVFSPEVKEPHVGADIGIIVDIQYGTERVVKSVLVQAKRVRQQYKNQDPMTLPDMAQQIQDMRKTTDEAYGLVFSDDSSYVFNPENPKKRIEVARFFEDQLRCTRGDRSKKAVAQAYDHSIYLDLKITSNPIYEVL